MRRFLDQSFRRKLLYGFLLIGIVPLLICTVLMLGIFQTTLGQNADSNAETQLQSIDAGLDEFFLTCAGVMAELREDAQVISVLDPGDPDPAANLYDVLYAHAAPVLNKADFSLFDREGNRLYSTASRPESARLPVNWGILQAAGEADELVFRDVEGFTPAASGDSFRCSCAVRRDGRVLGYVLMSMTETQLQRLFEGKYGSTSHFVLLDPFWSKVYSSPGARGDDLVPRLRAQLLAGQALSDGSGDYSYYVLKNGTSGLYLLLQQPKPMAEWTMHILYIVVGVLIVLCLFLCVAVSMGISRQLFEPIRALNSAMAEVEGGNLDVQVESRGTDEMGQLAGRFNRMVARLKSNLEQSLQQQRDLNDAQVRMMQAQLNPHFLYNTLDTIKWMGKINNVPEVATISADLADILRSSITSDEFVALEQELLLLDRYVEIQKIRFSGKFGLRTQVEPEVLDALVPKLMLQPLVENAIVHGFEDSDGGEIVVSACESGGELVVTVADDGCGMSEESLRRFQTQILPGPGRHLGLHNVDAILRLHYGPDHGLRFLPVAGRGTSIRITLPITRKGGDAPC